MKKVALLVCFLGLLLACYLLTELRVAPIGEPLKVHPQVVAAFNASASAAQSAWRQSESLFEEIMHEKDSVAKDVAFKNLTKMRAGAVPFLCDVLVRGGLAVRQKAILVIGAIGREAAIAVPILLSAKVFEGS